MNSTENTARLRIRRDGYWTLPQAILWIVTRDVAAVQPLSRSTDIGATMLAMAQYGVMGENGEEMPIRDDEVVARMPAGEVLGLLMVQMREGTVAARGVCGVETGFRQILPDEFIDLRPEIVGQGRDGELRLVAVKRPGAYWRLMQCRRADVVKVWPPATGPQRQGIRARQQVLQHLFSIMEPDRPMTKSEAKRRCLEEVPSAYAEAFDWAWCELPKERKRGAGHRG